MVRHNTCADPDRHCTGCFQWHHLRTSHGTRSSRPLQSSWRKRDVAPGDRDAGHRRRGLAGNMDDHRRRRDGWATGSSVRVAYRWRWRIRQSRSRKPRSSTASSRPWRISGRPRSPASESPIRATRSRKPGRHGQPGGAGPIASTGSVANSAFSGPTSVRRRPQPLSRSTQPRPRPGAGDLFGHGDLVGWHAHGNGGLLGRIDQAVHHGPGRTDRDPVAPRRRRWGAIR